MNKIICPHGITPKNKCPQCKKDYESKYRKTKEYRDGKNLYYSNNKKDVLKRNKDWRDKKKHQVEEILGIKCFFCPMTKNECKVNYHEIHGIKHPYAGSMKFKYILDHIKDFIPACEYCHKTIHALAKNRERIEDYLKFANMIPSKKLETFISNSEDIRYNNGNEKVI